MAIIKTLQHLGFLRLEGAQVWRTTWTKLSKAGPLDDTSFVQKNLELKNENAKNLAMEILFWI